MLLSQRLIVQRASVLGIEIPDDPDKVTDAVFLRLLSLCGGHERVVGVGRCFRLTSACLDNIYRCYGLQYLNLSYTQVTDISPIKDLPVLRSLSLCGLNCPSYDDLKWVYSLEVLNLNFSSISSVGALKDLQMLRSLDLGHTQISAIDELSCLTRLEELYIDSTLQIESSHTSDVVETMQSMVNMKYLQVGNTSLANMVQKFALALPAHTAILTKPRRIVWFESIINNDHETVKYMIQNGQDVNMRAGPSEIDLFTDESCRPNGAHVAIFFNAIECLELISMAQVNLRSCVWLGRMKKVELVEEDDDEEENFLSEEEELGEEDSEKITAQTETENDLSGKEYLKAEQERELKFEEEEKRREQVADKTDYGQRERVRQVLPPVFVKEFRRSSLAQMRSLSRELSTSGGDEKDEAVRGGNRKLSICPEMTLSNADIKMKKGVVTSLTGFVDKIYEAGVHRITERMTERRVTGWKQVCKGLANDLAEALKQRTLVTDMDSRRKRFTALATAQLQEIEIATAAARTAKLAAAEGSHADNPSVTDADPQAERPSSSQLDSRPASSSHVSLAFERSQRLPSIDRAASSSEKHDRGEYLDSTSLDGVAGECVENSREVASCDSEETGDGFLEDYTPAMREISKYEAHASKLIETQTLPISHEFDSDEGNVNLLGAKSFWLERYAQLVKEKRDDEERIYRANVKSYDPSSSRFFFNVGHPLSREERIAMLKATVKERRDNMTM